MAKLNMAVDHRLTQDEALTRIKTLLGEVKTQFVDKITDLQEQWEGPIGKFSFKAMGYGIAGTLHVKPNEVELIGNLPWQAAMFKGKIESVIRERAQTLLA